MSLAILLLWSGLLSVTTARYTLALGGPAADLRVRLVGGAALMAVLLVTYRQLTPPPRRAPAEKLYSPLLLATVLPGLALLQVPLPLVTKAMAVLVPPLAEAPPAAGRLILAELVWGLALLGVAAAIAARLLARPPDHADCPTSTPPNSGGRQPVAGPESAVPPRTAGPSTSSGPAVSRAGWSGPAPDSTNPTTAPWRGLALGLGAVYGALAVWTAQVQTLTGDEPHYLLAARSLVRDGDVDLTNDYASQEYREFFPSDALRRSLPALAPELDPHDVPGVHGERRPVHQLGTSLLLVPGYALLGVAGTRVVAVLLATLAGWLTVRLAVEVAGEAGWRGGLLVALLSPLLSLGPTLHSEPAAVVCLTYLAWQAARPGRGTMAILAAAVAAGFVCWLHFKLLPASLLLLAWLTIRSRQAGERGWWWPAAGLACGLASQLAVFGAMYGLWRPDAPQVAGAGKFPSAFGGRWWEGLPGLLFDQQDGLFMVWPVGLVLGIGVVRLWPRTETKWLTAVVGLHLGLIASYQLWRSGFAPAGRQLLPVVGLLGAFVGEGWRWLVWGGSAMDQTDRSDGSDQSDLATGEAAPAYAPLLCKILLAINVALVGLLAWLPRLRYPYEALDGLRRAPLLAKLPLPGADVVLPALDTGGAALVMAWVYLLAWVTISIRVGRRSEA